MKLFEFLYLCAEPFCPPLQCEIRARLKKITRGTSRRWDILDAGGRFSNYTIGIPANITVSDIPRNTQIQHTLHLGTTDSRMERLLRRRSNVVKAVYDDMTCSGFPDNSFDCIVAIEVLEHVERDEAFVAEVRRVLKPGGVFLMSTPNGEFVVNRNPDHKRHYTREQLSKVLSKSFTGMQIDYAVKNGYFYGLALRPWSLWHPIRTLATMGGGWISTIQSNGESVRGASQGTHQLIAIVTKEAVSSELKYRTKEAMA